MPPRSRSCSRSLVRRSCSGRAHGATDECRKLPGVRAPKTHVKHASSLCFGDAGRAGGCLQHQPRGQHPPPPAQITMINGFAVLFHRTEPSSPTNRVTDLSVFGSTATGKRRKNRKNLVRGRSRWFFSIFPVRWPPAQSMFDCGAPLQDDDGVQAH